MILAGRAGDDIKTLKGFRKSKVKVKVKIQNLVNPEGVK